LEDQQLTENIIKKVALRFFRHYYKFRLRYEDQPVTAKYDLEGVGGIVADGYYSFKKPDGKLFTATFEATSKESKDEVLYRADQRTLLWDGLAVTSLVMVALAFYNLRSPIHALDNTKFGERTALLILVGIMVLGFFALIARNFRRYRYIYAVEQFKKYYADEQWIALATDVFENKNDKHLNELKSQCVHNGIGLLTVDKNLDPKIVITPSRHDIFAGKRQVVDFMPNKQAQAIEQKGRLDIFPEIFNLNNKPKTLLRYRKSNHTQIALLTGSLALLAVIFIKELENPERQLVDKQEYTEKIAKSKSNNLTEPDTYLPDSSSLAKKKKDKPDGKFWELEKETVSVPAESPSAPLAENNLRSAGSDELTEKGGSIDILYDCSRFYNFDGKKYIVEVGEFREYKIAAASVKMVRGKGLYCAALFKSCFTDEEKGYMVYVGEIYNSAEEASKEMDAWVAKQKLTKKDLGNWKIRAIEPILK
jgi:hypothetical protein